MSLDVYVVPEVGGYKLINNILLKVNTTVNKINILLSTKIGSYIYAPNIGNPLIDIDGILSTDDIVTGINTCLQPLKQNGEIRTIDVLKNEIKVTSLNHYIISMLAVLSNGETAPIKWRKI